MHREIDATKLPAAVLQADREEAVYRAHESDLRRHLDAEEAAANRAARGYTAALNDFMGRVVRGEDFPMPAADGGSMSYRMSQILGEPFEDARQILFAASREAMRGQDCGPLLRQFVDAMARDYAVSHSERYE